MKLTTTQKIEIGKGLLVRANERDKRYESSALHYEEQGDAQSCWICMEARAENQRFIDKLHADIAKLEEINRESK